MTHEGAFRPTATQVHVYSWEWEGCSVPMMCQHCRYAPCITVCTPHAMTRDAAAGWVNLDQEKARASLPVRQFGMG
jgi:anaerobic carbon-monoxide dehydrogenase iron sulfur subunit